MKDFDMVRLNVNSLTQHEMSSIGGGFLGLLIAYVLQAALVGTIALGVIGNYQRGYDQAMEVEE